MNDREAHKIFRNLKVGRDYVWDPPEMYRDRHETIVMRVLSKSMSVGERPGIHIDALWFFVRRTPETEEKDATTTFTEGHPAGADNGWQRLDCMPRLWQGLRPTRTPLHAHYKCHDCEVSFKDNPKTCPHCYEEVSMSRRCGGKHDDLCLCEDCTNG